MKKRGMSWRIEEAQRRAKVLQLRANGEIRRWCGRWRPGDKVGKGCGLAIISDAGYNENGGGQFSPSLCETPAGAKKETVEVWGSCLGGLKDILYRRSHSGGIYRRWRSF